MLRGFLGWKVASCEADGDDNDTDPDVDGMILPVLWRFLHVDVSAERDTRPCDLHLNRVDRKKQISAPTI